MARALVVLGLCCLAVGCGRRKEAPPPPEAKSEAEPEQAPPPKPEAPKADPWANWTPPPRRAEEEAPDAGAPHPVVGMSSDELKSRFSDCFSNSVSIELMDGAKREGWSRSSSYACSKAHPDFGEVMLLVDPKRNLIERVVKKAEVAMDPPTTKYVYPDGGEAPAPK